MRNLIPSIVVNTSHAFRNDLTLRFPLCLLLLIQNQKYLNFLECDVDYLTRESQPLLFEYATEGRPAPQFYRIHEQSLTVSDFLKVLPHDHVRQTDTSFAP